MGKFRLSVWLLLVLSLLLSGCGWNAVGQSSESKLAQVSPSPTPLVQIAEVANSPEVKAPPAEVNYVHLKPGSPPQPKPKPKPRSQPKLEIEPPPTSVTPVRDRSQPSLSVEAPYPKAQSKTSRPPPSPIEVPYPKSQAVSMADPYPKSQLNPSVVEEAEAASRTLDSAIQSGLLSAGFWGTGHPYEMVYFHVVNRSPHPVQVRMVPGMILNPVGRRNVQPLLVTESSNFVLQPGESRDGSLLSFCLDSRVPAPQPGVAVNYRFSARTTDGGPRAVRAQRAAEELAGSSPYLHAITQIAIWKSLHQPVQDKHFDAVLGRQSRDPKVRQEVLREVDRVLRTL